MSQTPPHPHQPIELDDEKVPRFRGNKIVRYILDRGVIDMNVLATIPFETEEWEQFYQLIGYSVNGYMDLSCVRETTKADVWELVLRLIRDANKRERTKGGTELRVDAKGAGKLAKALNTLVDFRDIVGRALREKSASDRSLQEVRDALWLIINGE